MDKLETQQMSAGTPEKFVDWKNPPQLANLQQDLRDAQSVHDAQVSKISNWLKNLEEGGAPPKGAPPNSSKIAPKLIRKQAEWRYPALTEPFLSSPDVFNVKPISWEDKQAARQNEMLLNYQFNTQINKVSFVDEYVRTAVDEGTTIVRVGWEFEESEYEEEEQVVRYVIDPAFAPMVEQLDQMKAQDPGRYAVEVPPELKNAHRLSHEQGQPVRPQMTGEVQQVKKKKTLKNRPTLEVCDYRNVVVDPTCKGDITKAKFVVYSFPASMDELKRSGRYKNLEFINLGTETILGQPDFAAANDAAASFNFHDNARKKFVVREYWGFWDIHGTGKTEPIVAAWVGDVLIRMEINPFPDKALPFVLVHYLPKRGSTHGEPDGALLEDNQKVVGAVTRGMIDILGKSANGQTGMRKDMLDATNKRRFEAGMDYEFNANVDPRQGIHMHTYPEIPASAQVMLQMQNMEAESLTGVKSFNQGVSGASLGEVATAVRGALDAASKRELNILRRLAQGMIEIGRKIIAMNAEFLSETEVIRVTNEDFVEIRRDDLAGNFDLQLSISTAEEDNNKAQELAFMLQTIGPNSPPDLYNIILAEICRLRKMPDFAKRLESYKPQPDPVQQQRMQLELALLQAQVEREQAEVMKLRVDMQLSGAKVSTEMAKAQNLQSDTDLRNLDFIEQESGVKQARDMQLHGEQARSQAQLKIIDQELQREKMQNDLVKEYLKARMRPKSSGSL